MSIFCRSRIMASLRIPEDAFPSLVSIVSFDEDSFGALIKAIKESKPSLTHMKFISLLSSKLPKAQLEATKEIFESLFGLFDIKQSESISESKLSEFVLESALKSEEYGPKFTGENGNILKKRLTELLSLDNPLGITSKALDVLTDNERIFCEARILSDIRPVFTGNLDYPSGAVTIHNLKISFHKGDESPDIYFALDDTDLEILKDTIERAQNKSKALDSILKKANIPRIEG